MRHVSTTGTARAARTMMIAVAVLAGAVIATGTTHAQTAGTFAGTPNFGSGGQAAAVFLGGSVEQLEAASRAVGANGAWVQDGAGQFQLLIVDGPAFLRDAFVTRFPGGFTSALAVTLTGTPGAARPPAIATSTPATPPPAVPVTPPGGVPGPSSND